MTAPSILRQLESFSADGYKRILLNHGVREPVLGAKIEHLRKVGEAGRRTGP